MTKKFSFDRMKHTLGVWDFQEESTNSRQLKYLKKVMYQVIHTRLTQRQSQMLCLYYLEGLTYQQIADKLGVNKSTVCRTVRRASERLKAYLEFYQTR